jgi:hypothetical protein
MKGAVCRRIQVAYPCRVSAVIPVRSNVTGQLPTAHRCKPGSSRDLPCPTAKHTPVLETRGCREVQAVQGLFRSCVPVVSTTEPFPGTPPQAVQAPGSSRECSRYLHPPRSGGGHRRRVPLPVLPEQEA